MFLKYLLLQWENVVIFQIIAMSVIKGIYTRVKDQEYLNPKIPLLELKKLHTGLKNWTLQKELVVVEQN